MAENSHAPHRQPDDHKLSSKLRWGAKIFANKESKDAAEKSKINDLNDFLKPSSNQSTAPPTPPRAPRLDVSAASRWPSAAELTRTQSSGVVETPAPAPTREMLGRGKRSRTVGFVEAPPEVIGHGGAEEDTPVIVISRARAGTAKPQLERRPSLQGHREFRSEYGAGSGSQQRDNEDKLARPNALSRSLTSHGETSDAVKDRLEFDRRPLAYSRPQRDEDDPGFRPAPLKRAPTGWGGGVGQSESPADQPQKRSENFHKSYASQRTEPDVAPPSASARKPVPFASFEDREAHTDHPSSSPVDLAAITAKRRTMMREEEAKAFHASFNARDDEEDDHQLESGSWRSNASMRAARPAERPADHHQTLQEPLPDPRRSRSSSNSRREGSPTASSFQQHPHRKPVPSPLSPPGAAPRSPYLPPEYTPASSYFANSTTHSSPDSMYSSSYLGSKPSLDDGRLKSPTAYHSPGGIHPSSRPEIHSSSSQRGDSSMAADAALQDFATRVVHMKGIFRLTSELEGPVMKFSPRQWLRAGIWWFIKGRTEVELLFRNRPRSSDSHSGQHPPEPLLKQPHVDIAKALWIVTDVMENLPDIEIYHGDLASKLASARHAGAQREVEILTATVAVHNAIKILVLSMSRNQLMPPQQALLQGQDQTVWIKYPRFAGDVNAVLSGSTSKSLMAENQLLNTSPLALIPLGDNQTDFCFGRMFIQASLSTEDAADESKVAIPCVLSILRGHNDWQPKITICSQTELVNIGVQSDRRLGPTWEDVRWHTKTRRLDIRLPRGFTLAVDMAEKDFKTLWGIYDYTKRIEANMRERRDEHLVHETALKDFQYAVTAGSPGFPPERVPRCRVRVFERTLTLNEGAGQRRLHRGYRLMVVTSTKYRSLSCVSHDFGGEHPVAFEIRSDPSGEKVPVLVLRVKEKDRQCTLLLGFQEKGEMDRLFSTLNGMLADNSELVVAKGPLKGLSIHEAGQADGVTQLGRDVLKGLEWRDFWVTNKDPDDPSVEQATTVMSDNLRVIARHAAGSFTDRINLGKSDRFWIRLVVAKLTCPERPRRTANTSQYKWKCRTQIIASRSRRSGYVLGLPETQWKHA